MGPFVRCESLELSDPDGPLGKDSPNLQLSAHSGNTPSHRAYVHVGAMFQLGIRVERPCDAWREIRRDEKK
jgi:hypothetical protein